MKVLVIGAGGMMGHMACRVLGSSHEVHGTLRQPFDPAAPAARFLSRSRWVPDVHVDRFDTVRAAIEETGPAVVLNCVGIVKQLEAAKNAIVSIEINALLPHLLADECSRVGARLVHLSTDCVFSGQRGQYREQDLPDPVDLYGRSKLLGETAEGEALTIRTSIVGRQLTGQTSLFEWVLANRGQQVRGFDRAIYSGLTTMALARVIGRLIDEQPELSGVWQVASAPVTKYELLQMLDGRLDLGLTIERDTDFACDRSLDGSAFRQRTGIEVPTWTEMLDDFATDQVAYA